MKFQIIPPRSVQKELVHLPDEIANRILARLSALKTNLRPLDVKKFNRREIGFHVKYDDDKPKAKKRQT